jgi:hypothetical protein
MKKKLQNKDLSKVVKVKLVKLLLGNEFNTQNRNRFYFTNDGQLDDKIIVAIQVHPAPSGPNPGPTIVPGEEVPFASIYNAGINYEDDYYSGIVQSNILTGISSTAFLSLVDKQGRFFWYQQPLSSLTAANMGKYQKKLYNRITLDKCYIELGASATFGIAGIPITTYQLFSFYYIDDPNF